MQKQMQDMTEPELGHLMTLLANGCNRILNAMTNDKSNKFVILVFNDPKVAQYISSCNREDAIKSMRECAHRLENKEEIERSSVSIDSGG